MKKILFSLLACVCGGTAVMAAPGDTTFVSAHPVTSFLSYGNFDHPVTFPNGSLSYRKINMIFTLGKETCAPGSQYCAQWDYTVRIWVMTPTDTFELGRFITPYAHSSYPNMPLDWTHDYVFDVTDFYPILKDGAVMRIKYEGYSWGFTGKLDFQFIEGTPPRDVVAIQNMWDGSFAFGQTANPINNHTAPLSLTVPTGTVYAEASHIISGHGSDDQTNNCAEFCNKWYRWLVDGSNLEQRNIWRDDCGDNWVYPQSGTWVYNRANWCPGDIVFPIVHKVPAASIANGSFTAGMEFQPYTSSNQSNPPSYTSSNVLFFYKEFNHNVDAGIEDIVAPSSKDLYFRSNPICAEPKVKVKNYGKNTITSIAFDYGIDGGASGTYTWTGTLEPMQSAVISLPTLAAFKTITGDGHGFTAVITEVNGSADAEPFNDTARSTFEAPPHWETGNFVINLKTSGITQPGNASKWIIRDEGGNILYQRSSTTANTNYRDTIHLENGCYSMEVIAEAGYGFKFLTAFTPGWITVAKLSGGYLNLPKSNPGASSLDGDFGNGFVQEFMVVNSEPPVSLREVNRNINLAIAPNPASTELRVKIEGLTHVSGTIVLHNMLGQTVRSQKVSADDFALDVHDLPAGIYTLIFESAQGSSIERVVISR